MTDKRKSNSRKLGSKNKIQGQIAKAPRKTASVKKDNSDYSALTNEEFLKVREGETQKQWEQRTRKRRPISLTNHHSKRDKEIEFLPNGTLRFHRRKLEGLTRHTKTSILVKYHEKPHDFMKNYSLVMRWASIKYAMMKDDIEIGFYFYDHEPFTKETFNRYCVQLGTVRGVFARFYKSGYINPIEIDMGPYRKSETVKVYTLSFEFISKIRKIYEVIAQLVPVTLTMQKGKKLVDKDLTDELLKMYDEANEIIVGLRKPDKMRFRNEE